MSLSPHEVREFRAMARGRPAAPALSLDEAVAKKPKVDGIKEDGAKASVKYLPGNMLSVATRKGTRFYDTRVLTFMLVKLYQFSKERARSMCWGYGLDQRPKPKHRALSCQDVKARGHSAGQAGDCHSFPSGFSFAVNEKYQEYKKPYDEQDFR